MPQQNAVMPAPTREGVFGIARTTGIFAAMRCSMYDGRHRRGDGDDKLVLAQFGLDLAHHFAQRLWLDAKQDDVGILDRGTVVGRDLSRRTSRPGRPTRSLWFTVATMFSGLATFWLQKACSRMLPILPSPRMARRGGCVDEGTVTLPGVQDSGCPV